MFYIDCNAADTLMQYAILSTEVQYSSQLRSLLVKGGQRNTTYLQYCYYLAAYTTAVKEAYRKRKNYYYHTKTK